MEAGGKYGWTLGSGHLTLDKLSVPPFQLAIVTVCVSSRGYTTGLFPISCPQLGQYNVAGTWQGGGLA